MESRRTVLERISWWRFVDSFSLVKEIGSSAAQMTSQTEDSLLVRSTQSSALQLPVGQTSGMP